MHPDRAHPGVGPWNVRLCRRMAYPERADPHAVRRWVRGGQRCPPRYPSQSRQGRWRLRSLREQRKRRSALESGCLPARPCAGSRPLLAGGRPTLRARHGVRRARPGTPVLLAGRRAVANRDDPSAGVPIPHARSLQSNLFYDYRTNVAAYPRWQAWLQNTQPKLLVLWGKYDPSFDVGEPQRFRKDVPNAEVHILDAGHFALDTKADEIAALIGEFMKTQKEV